MPTPKELYARQMLDIIARYGTVEDEAARQIANLLRQARLEINASIGASSESGQIQLGALRANIDAILAGFEAQAASGIDATIRDVFTLGGSSAVKPLQAIGVPGVAYWQPSAATLNILTGFSADLVTAVTADVRMAVNRQVQLASLGQITPFQAMKNLSQTFGDAGIKQGATVVSTGITAKAERVVRTEVGRVFNAGNFSQMKELGERGVVKGLLKRWIATGDSKTRASHLRIHNETRVKPIPWDEPFKLHTPGKPVALLMFPQDPAGPAYETINCRCSQVSIHPAVGVIGSPLDGQIAAELKRREA